MKSSVYGFTAQALALAATLGLSLNGAHRAQAAPTAPAGDSAPAVTILSPVPRTAFAGIKPVEISAFYQGTPGNRIAALELYVDGVKVAQKVLESPEDRGVVSFLVDAGALSGGTHRIVVRASAEDAEVTSAKSSFIFRIPTPEQPDMGTPSASASQGAPTLNIQNPSTDGQVQGTVTIRINAQDPSGKPPYVSLFIDHNFKTLRNYAPYEFTWDTTDAPNGYHTIEAFGYNDAQNVAHAQPMRIFVNNPGGRTARRTDLHDAPKRTVKAQAAIAAPVRAKVAPIRRRPTPALLAQAAPSASAKQQSGKRPQIARLPNIFQEEMALAGLPGLADPFVANTVRPKSVTPTRGFKPLHSSVKTSQPLLALTPAAKPTAVQPHQMAVAKAALPDMALTSKFLTSPTMPSLKETARTLTGTPQAAVRMLRVVMPMAATSHAHKFALHTPRLSAQMNWMHALGQTSVMFNSRHVQLERPLTAHGSILFGPLRQIFQSGGGSLMWQARTGVVTAHTAAKDIELTMGDRMAVVNHTPVALDGAPYLNHGRTMIPLSFLKTALDVTVQYDPATGHLQIMSNK